MGGSSTPVDPELQILIQRWLRKADQDLALAERVVHDEQFREAVGFHAQQAVEKYVKAVLVLSQLEFPKTHDIEKLLNVLDERNPALARELRPAEWLTPFGVEARYPSDAPEMRPGEEIEAIETARKVKNAISEFILAQSSPE